MTVHTKNPCPVRQAEQRSREDSFPRVGTNPGNGSRADETGTIRLRQEEGVLRVTHRRSCSFFVQKETARERINLLEVKYFSPISRLGLGKVTPAPLLEGVSRESKDGRVHFHNSTCGFGIFAPSN
jgi:hypothetical protein